MDTAMRDFDQIEERANEQGPSRFVALWAIAAIALLGIVFAALASLSEEEAAAAPDPLDTLNTTIKAQAVPGTEPPAADIDPKSLTFHNVLLQSRDPEVIAAVEAAAAELEHPDPLVDPPPTRRELAAKLPAAVTAGPDQEVVARAVESDPLVVSALPEHKDIATASQGHDGKLTLQVASYRSRKDANMLAQGLRKRGHHAYVIQADVPDRGVHFRVRIGPFESVREARAYRAKFEREEGMNTFVVRKR